MRMRTRFYGLAAAGCLIAAITGGATTATASAATTQHAFAAQASAAGLTNSQSQELQEQIETELAEFGGTQTAANKISLPNGSELLLPLPGEVRARDLDAPSQAKNLRAPSSCDYYTFCAYSGTGFTGQVLRQRLCSEPIWIPWYGAGSWSNNQSSGTRARMYNGGETLVYTTPGAYSEDRTGDWSSVVTVDAC